MSSTVSYRASGLSLLRHGTLPVVKKESRVFCGNTRKFSNVYRVLAMSKQEGVAARRRVSASTSESVHLEPLPQEDSLALSDSPTSWVEHWLPKPAVPYAMLARLDKPNAIWLYAWPCFWSIAMAAKKAQLLDIKLLALFGFGSAVIRGLACTVNDLLDQDFDKKVSRTKSRPLASGALTTAQGFNFLVFQVLLYSFGFLLQLNNYSHILGAAWLVLFSTYPLMKRITYWPQAYLGLGMNWGAFFGWAAIKGSLDYAVILPMYIAGICWTLVYDTIYAHQDRKDDLKAGVKSTAVRFGDDTKNWISGFGAVCIGGLALCGYNAHLAWPYYAFLAAAAGHLVWQIATVDLSNGPDCNNKFVSNKWFGALVFGGILCAKLAS